MCIVLFGKFSTTMTWERRRRGDKYYYDPTIYLYSSNAHALLSTNWVTWYKGEKVPKEAKSIFHRRFHWRRRCRIVLRSLFLCHGSLRKHSFLLTECYWAARGQPTSFWWHAQRQEARRNGCFSLRSKLFRLVSQQRKTEERDSRFWPREKWNKSQKMKVGGGGGEGRKSLQTNPSILKACVRQRTQRLIGSVSWTMLTCVDQRFVSYWEEGMVRDTYISFQWLLFILVGKICPPMQERFLWLDLFWKLRLFLRLNKGFRSFNLI